MPQYLEDAGADGTLGQRGMQRPYVKPFVRSLGAAATEAKDAPSPFEEYDGNFSVGGS